MSFVVHKNEQHIVDIVDLTSEGHGVAKIEQYPIFIPGVLVGEKVEIKIVKTLKKYGFGKLLTILEESRDRVEPPCPVYDACGGCQMQHLSYEAQLQQKWQNVRQTLDRIGHLQHVPVHPVKGMSEPWRYRNKSQVPLQQQGERAMWGFYRPRTHDVVETSECLIQSAHADRILNGMLPHLQRLQLEPYDEQTLKGTLRHIVVRVGEATGQLMVVLVTNVKKLAKEREIVEQLLEIEPTITSIVQNVNMKNTNVILGHESTPIYGPAVIEDELNGITFEISANSFYQVNRKQTEVLYDQALQYADLTGKETVIDAYCGIGTISLSLAKRAKHVYGVEIVPAAIADAKRNAELNGIENATFLVGKSEEIVPEWYAEGKKFDVLVVDPPRKGCDAQLLETILTYKPERVVYVSCNPATLARDLKILHEGGYNIEEVQPVDMFGHSTHIENVAKLTVRPM
ncbi:23S rRNA (uracil(1939)-C(5))-methyltransferase RlmD [Savagea faecisuis]|uniref:23S rRNA (Uracil(1939)-C(5))-methyltransferase RlmD n=1 Tax=Savagea faecisuis TaxID=1274803 RepID=A0ABW3GZB4_9BACL